MLKALRHLAIASFLIPLTLPLTVSAASYLPSNVEKSLKASKVSPQSLSVAVVPLSRAGDSNFYNADVSVNPASTMKIITTYAALELLGPTYQWRTDFYADGPVRGGVLNGNLYFKGGGDPKLNMEKLWLLLRDLRANGVTKVTGDLVLDRSYFKQPQLPAFNDDGGDKNKPYLVTPDSLLVNLKAVRVVTRNDGGKINVSIEPPIATIRVDNRVKALKAAKCPAWPEVRLNPVAEFDGTTLIVDGKLADGCSSQAYLSLLDHPSYAAGAVRAIWAELGGSILGKDRQGSVPSSAKLLARAYSPDLVEIIRDINKYSNNTMARQLFLSIGAKYRTPADADDSMAAQRAIRSWLARKGITATQLVMENGSGLSRAERVSVREMSKILQTAWKSPYAAEFISSLPLTAMDGTMRKRLRRTPMEGQGHIKTGTLNNVRAISGFSRDKNGDYWAVVAILNDPKPWGASAVLDQVLLDVYKNPRTK
ncbi:MULTISPECIES: D-alanyl-D-alanine carboxypeptidase/D-alanyl-D-alanine endopeptidase [Pseudomonas]|uniref:D-alanyl-D-alanine carboxypeptidase/D-alanyl-D-alanine endopeptidase n=1 Tax=Pseudomonas TaxID=286 RepID=UPI0008E085C5|nr:MULTISPECIES: D-alanyl-D-alanine carboxypeptidase/D-alanyl-D-alanine-endopeptidase [Pseudomonas]SFT41237.1 D-alanyl-D-alanine carboxypeptidase / D-alanyl-D-alanine-endopeptidase (penicillin-binding protein 4) [Pseudomonas marincola]